MNTIQKVKAYEEILKVIKKHSDLFQEDRVVPETSTIRDVLRALDIQHRFGIPLKHLNQGGSSYSVERAYDDWTRVALFGDKSISWSDDGSQPDDEWLFRISFGCGAYIFGEAYPVDTFNAFFNELKSYSPKYVDSMNHGLYFTEEHAKAVYDNFWDIFNKYKAKVADEVKEQRKQKLLEELEKLNGEGK